MAFSTIYSKSWIIITIINFRTVSSPWKELHTLYVIPQFLHHNSQPQAIINLPEVLIDFPINISSNIYVLWKFVIEIISKWIMVLLFQMEFNFTRALDSVQCSNQLPHMACEDLMYGCSTFFLLCLKWLLEHLKLHICFLLYFYQTMMQ